MAEQTPIPEIAKLDLTSKENRWYYKELTSYLPAAARKLLEEYSQISPEDVDSHVYKMVHLILALRNRPRMVFKQHSRVITDTFTA